MTSKPKMSFGAHKLLSMDYKEYLGLFEKIIDNRLSDSAPYNDHTYLHYTKLNYSRMKRWEKTLVLDENLVEIVKGISDFQRWIIIVEPWCGDAAPTVPFLIHLAQQNPLIQYNLQLRDEEPFLINSYLTNGSKSIPKLIVQDGAGSDLFTWGPRPLAAQKVVDELKAANVDFETSVSQLQDWYNKDKGVELQKELLVLFRGIEFRQAVS